MPTPLLTQLIKHLNEVTEDVVLNNNFLAAMKEGRVSQDAWRTFAIQRYLSTTVFEDTLRAAIRGAQKIEDKQLEKALQENLNDETGIGKDGVQDLAHAHRTWRRDFYLALGVLDEQAKNTKPFPGTKSYMDAMAKLTREGDALACAGALLAVERLIPQEFERLQKGRDAAFHDAFANNPKARLYIDDHIIHDATSHYPDLLVDYWQRHHET